MALSRYLAEVTPTKKPTTQHGDKFVAKLLTKHFGHYSMATLTADKIAEFRDLRIKDGKSNNTVRLDLALLSHLYNTAIKEWGIGLTVNPVRNVRKPKAGEGRNRRLVGDEEKRLISACNEHSNPFLGWIVRLALYTGMRRGEIINLTRKDINMSKRTITLKDTKNHSIRTVPLTEKAHKALTDILKFKIQPHDTDLIFFGEPGRGGLRKPYTINRVWSEALKRAKIEDLKFHDLRHEATSRFVEAGLSDQQVASITGHKSMQMLRRYTHLRSEDLVSQIKNI